MKDQAVKITVVTERDVLEQAESIRVSDTTFYRGLGRVSLVDTEKATLERGQEISLIARRNDAVEAIGVFDAIVLTHPPDSPEYIEAQTKMHSILDAIGPQKADEALILAKAKKIENSQSSEAA